MEGVSQEPVALVAAMAAGALAMLVGSRLLNGRGDAAVPPAAEPAKPAAQSAATGNAQGAKAAGKKKKNAKKGKGGNKQEQPQQQQQQQQQQQEAKAKAEPTPDPAPAPEKKEVEEPKKEAAPKKAPEPAQTTSKNKNKKKNKKKAAAESKPAAPAPAVTQAEQEENTTVLAPPNGVSFEDPALEDDGWTTIPSRSKKKKATTDAANLEVDSSGITTIVVGIGAFSGDVIGKKGEQISKIQEQSGAKVDVDRGTEQCKITGTREQVLSAQGLISDIIGNKLRVTVDLGAKRTLVFGPGGATIQKISKDTGARLDLERNSDVCVISGEYAAVQQAKSIVEDILNSSKLSTVVLEGKDRAAVIGKGGENVRRLQEESGATLDIDSETSICTISGEPAQVAKAQELIKLYIEHRGPPPEHSETLTVPSNHGHLVIGKSGAMVQELQRSTGTRINVSHGGSESTIVVAGDRANVTTGVNAIRKLIADNSHVTEVTLSSSNLVKAVIGEKGAVINGIRDATNARLDVVGDKVVITGTKEQIAKAKAQVDKTVAAELGPPPVPAGQVQDQVDVGSAAGRIIGSGGSNMTRLMSDHKVSIDVKEGTMCYVTGPKAGVEAAMKEINEVLEHHAEMLEKAKKQEEELAKVANPSMVDAVNSASTNGYSGWDCPPLKEPWGNALDVSAVAWGSSSGASSGW